MTNDRRYTTDLYFEAHVTIEPVFGVKLEDFKYLCGLYGFRVADLVMIRNRQDTPERSNKDTFCTGRGLDYSWIEKNTKALVSTLTKQGFDVWRYKIENTLLDVRLKVVDLSEKPV